MSSETDTDTEFLDGQIGRPITVSDRVRLFALARRGAAMRWRPIEEAPKETGKYLLGWNGHHSGVIQFFEPNYEGDPEWVSETTEFIEPPITHWMPLPPPPKGAEE